MKQIKIGIISTGGIADTAHAPAINAVEGTFLAAVLSRDESKGRDFLQKHGSETGNVHTSLEAFVDDPDIDLAVICSPDGLHAQQAKACLKAGKHVLLEKPMALSLEDATELVELAEQNNLKLAVGFHLRSHNGHLALRQRIVEQEEIGAVRHIRAIWAFLQSDDSNWRAKDELTKWWSLSAVGSHCIDLTRWFGNDQDDWKSFSVTTANNLWDGPHDETAIITGQLQSGSTVEIVSSVQFGPYNRIEIFGETGMAVCESTMGRDGGGEIRINNELVPFEIEAPFINQLKDMTECIRTGKDPRANGLAGVRSVKDLLLAIS